MIVTARIELLRVFYVLHAHAYASESRHAGSFAVCIHH